MTASAADAGNPAVATGRRHLPMGQDYLEVIPTPGIAERLVHVPPGSWIGVSCSPSAGIGPTLDVVDRIGRLYPGQGLRPVPHLAARVFRDREHLADAVCRLREAGVQAVLVPGGDAKAPAGRYRSALDLLRDLEEIAHPFRHVGVAAHPEGHPLVGGDELLRILLEKQRHATYLVTQMCFDPAAITGWLRTIRRAGVTLHAWIGLPGVLEIHKLAALSLRIGVGRSLGMLKKRPGLARSLVNGAHYRPDDLFDGLRAALADPALGVQGCHLFSFNNVEATERWRTETLNHLEHREQASP